MIHVAQVAGGRDDVFEAEASLEDRRFEVLQSLLELCLQPALRDVGGAGKESAMTRPRFGERSLQRTRTLTAAQPARTASASALLEPYRDRA